MSPAERKKLQKGRAILKGYRIRLIAMKDLVPNMDELLVDNEKIISFFESGQAEKYESKLKGLNIRPGKALDKDMKKMKVDTKLTVDIYRQMKANGLNDNSIKSEYGMHANKLNNWKKANGLMGVQLQGGRPSQKKEKEMGVNLLKLTVEVYKKLKDEGLSENQIAENLGLKVGSVYQFKSTNGLTGKELEIESVEEVETAAPITEIEKPKVEVSSNDLTEGYKERIRLTLVENGSLKKELAESNAKVGILEAELEKNKSWNNKNSIQNELAKAAERQAIEELIVYQADYRKLEVDFLNKSTEIKRLNAMLDKLKHTEQINVWLMKQHIGFVEQADEMAEVYGQ